MYDVGRAPQFHVKQMAAPWGFGVCASLRRPKLPTLVNQPKTPKKGHFGWWEIS